MDAPLLYLAGLLPKFKRRLPPVLAGAGFWQKWEDRLIVGHYLSRPRRKTLTAAFRQCRTTEDWHDFAAGMLPPHQVRSEIVRFIEFTRSVEPRTVMEIGTASGGTNFLLGAALPEVTLKLGVDLFVQRIGLLEAFCRPDCRQVFIQGSSYAPATVARVREALGGRDLDVLFIDGDHAYSGVKADFETYLPFVRPGGLIALHDIVPDFRTRHGRPTGRWTGDVPRFWSEIRGAFAETWEIVEDPEQDGLGIGVVRRPTS